MLFINSTISFVEENSAGNAAAALMAGLAPKAKVFVHNNGSVAKLIYKIGLISSCIHDDMGHVLMLNLLGLERWKMDRAGSIYLGSG